MKLKLKRPLFFFDLETTGTDIVHDRIVEIAYIKLMPNGTQESKTRRINPEMHIPEEATAVHGITDEDVRDCPTFSQIAKSLANIIGESDLAGFNSSRFDIPLLAEEFLRAGVDIDLSQRKSVDMQIIYHRMEPRNLTAAYKYYCGKELEGAHGAGADTQATFEVFMGQLEMYADQLPTDVDQLSEEYSGYHRNVDFAGRIIYDDNGVEIVNFGKYKGQPVEEVFKRDTGYYDWIMKGDFTANTKQVLTRLYIRMKQKENKTLF